MLRDIFDFILATLDLIRETTIDTAVWTRDNVILPTARVSVETVQWWYTRATTYSIAGVIIITILTIASIFADIYFENGVASAILGIVIAIPLLTVLLWWTPLVGAFGGAASLLKFKFKSTPESAMQYASNWLTICLVIVFWQLIISFFLSWIPFYNRLISLPFIILTSLILALMGAVWVKSLWYRTIITTIVVAVLFMNTLGCFSPRLYESVTRFTGVHLEYYATKFEAWSSGKEAVIAYTKWRMKNNYGSIKQGQIVGTEKLIFTKNGLENMIRVVPQNNQGLFIGVKTDVPYVFLEAIDEKKKTVAYDRNPQPTARPASYQPSSVVNDVNCPSVEMNPIKLAVNAEIGSICMHIPPDDLLVESFPSKNIKVTIDGEDYILNPEGKFVGKKPTEMTYQPNGRNIIYTSLEGITTISLVVTRAGEENKNNRNEDTDISIPDLLKQS